MDHTVKAGIESDLRRYKKWKARIKQIDAELNDFPVKTAHYEITGVFGGSGGTGDPTFIDSKQRTRLANERIELEKKVERVENALDGMSKHEREVVKRWYFEGEDRQTIMNEMEIGKNKVYEYKNKALEIYAEVSGLVAVTK